MAIYFDCNATNLIDPRVVEAMTPYFSQYLGNPSSLHRYGRLVHTAVESARAQVAQLVNAHPEQIFFTGSGTEANNWAIKGVYQKHQGRIITSAIEHSSVLKTIQALQSIGAPVTIIPVNSAGSIELATLLPALTPDTRLVSLMFANNETGVIQDIKLFANAVRDRNIIFHTDAIQALGKIPVDFNELGVQLMAISAHKIGGPQGVGALIFDRALEIAPLIDGGGQEAGFRSGTLNVAGIVGFGKAAALAQTELAERHAKMKMLQDHFERGLSELNSVKIIGANAPRLPNTTLLQTQTIEGTALLINLDIAGFAVSTGSACSSQHVSHVPLALGLSEEEARNIIRVSFSAQNTLQEVDQFLIHLASLV